MLNKLPINLKDEPFVGLLFQIHVDQIQEELDMLNQQRSQAQQGINQNDAAMQDDI